LHHEREAERGEDAWGPGAHGEDEAGGAVRPTRRRDLDAVAVRTPRDDRLAEAQVGAVASGQLEVRLDRGLGVEHPRARLEDPDDVVGKPPRGKATSYLLRRQLLERQPVLQRASS